MCENGIENVGDIYINKIYVNVIIRIYLVNFSEIHVNELVTKIIVLIFRNLSVILHLLK